MTKTKAELKKEVEALREKVRELEALQLRIWQAFSAADATLRRSYAEDRRGKTSQKEAERLTIYMTGDKVTP